MNKFSKDRELIQEFSLSMHGVFSSGDLQNLMGELHRSEFYRRVRQLVKSGDLVQFCRGIYCTETFDPEILNARVCPASYISFGYILAEQLAIGSIPRHRLDAVRVGRNREYSNSNFTIRHFGISETLNFGFEVQGGVRKANLEKAFLDTLYFHQHGAKFGFDVYSDIQIQKFNKTLLKEYLGRYKNPKFTRFVRGILDATS